MRSSQKLIAFTLVLALAALACAPLDFALEIAGLIATASVTATPTQTSTPTATPDLDVQDWYVAPDGDDANSCMSPGDPCLHLSAAVLRSTPSDHIHIAAGTIIATGSDFAVVSHDLAITGEGATATILDGQGTVGGIRVSSTAVLTLEGLTIQDTNVRSANACLHVADTATANVNNVVLRSCLRQGVYVESGAFLFMNEVEIRDMVDENTDLDFILNGYGVMNLGTAHADGGSIHHNAADGVVNQGNMNFSNVRVHSNALLGFDAQGGTAVLNSAMIYNNGTGLPRGGVSVSGILMIYDSEIYNNVDQGINVLSGGDLLLTRVIVRDHASLGLAVRSGGIAEAEASTFDNNVNGGSFGAGVQNQGDLILSASHVVNNGDIGVYNIGNAHTELYDTDVTDNAGRGIYNQDSGGEMLLFRVLVARNLDGTDSAVSNYGTMTLENVTISNNRGTGMTASTLTYMSYVTIADNSGQGLVAGGSGPLTIDNSLLARNTGGDCNAPLSGAIIAGLNIDSDGSCGSFTTYSTGEIRLGTLANNGGFTHTLALQPGSVAIDTAISPCPSSDQRGLGFARPAGAACDVGAYEADAAAPTPEAIIAATETPTATTPQGDVLIVDTDTSCFAGPGFPWDFLLTLVKGTELDIFGYSFGGSYFVTSHPTSDTFRCWVHENDVSTTVDIANLRLIAIPPKPTATLTPTRTPTPCVEGFNNKCP
jgi:hypothetical protein